MKARTTHLSSQPSPAPAIRDFRSYLQSEFVRRCQANSQYSLRAFARNLEIDQSLLSKFLRGQRALSKPMILKIGSKLGLSEDETQKLLPNKNSETDFNQKSEDTFIVISDWYHFALLELLKTNQAQPNMNWMAERLGIEEDEVALALQRLGRLGFVQEQNGQWILLSPDNTWTNSEFTSIARRNLQKSLVQKSLDAIENIDFQLRENGALTIACDESLLPEVKKRMFTFRREIDAFIQSHGNYNQVYQLVMSFFPLTQKTENVP